MIWLAVRLNARTAYHRTLMWVCDRVGWTKLYHMPETDTMRAFTMRHGRKCSGSPNCDNMNCIGDSVPRWFKWLTRWGKP